MAAALETNAELIKPLEGAEIQRFTAGSTLTAGSPVVMSSDGYIDHADSDALATSIVIGVVLQDAVSGDRVDVVTHGPVLCLTGATIGAPIYANATAGDYGETAGTKSTIIGIAIAANVLHVHPIWITLS